MMKKLIAVGFIAICVLFLTIEYRGSSEKIERAVANEKEMAGRENGTQIEQATHLFEKVIVLNEEQPIYIKDNTLTEIGVGHPNTSFAIVGEDELYYELRFGKISAFIKKGSATVEKRSLQTLVNTEITNSIKTTEQTKVYEEKNLTSSVLLQLSQGFRYPIVGEVDGWFVIKVGERAGYIHKSSVEIDEGIPVLVYHHILPKEEMVTSTSTVSVQSFEQQMAFLAEEQFTTISTTQLYDYLEGRHILPVNSILITFDDGLLSTKVYAYPILKEHGFSAVQHIISSRTGRFEGEQVFDGNGPLQFFTADEMQQMTDVFQFEAHTHNLHQFSKGAGIALEMSSADIAMDLQQNVNMLTDAISLAYPFGHYDEDMIEAMKEVGLLIGFTTNEGYANMQQSNYEVNRFGITENKTFEQFTSYVKGVNWS